MLLTSNLILGQIILKPFYQTLKRNVFKVYGSLIKMCRRNITMDDFREWLMFTLARYL